MGVRKRICRMMCGGYLSEEVGVLGMRDASLDTRIDIQTEKNTVLVLTSPYRL